MTLNGVAVGELDARALLTFEAIQQRVGRIGIRAIVALCLRGCSVQIGKMVLGESMRETLCRLALLAIAVASAGAQARLINIDDYSRRTGYFADIHHETLAYDARAQWLSYAGEAHPFSYVNTATCVNCTLEALHFDGHFLFSAGVDASGHVIDSGGMSWVGDFGHGLEVLAIGRLVQIGSAQQYVMTSSQYDRLYFTLNLQFLFDLSFLDPRVAGMGDQILLLVEQKIETLTEGPFSSSFRCEAPPNMPTSTHPRCGRWSTSGLVGLEVPEPSTLSLSVAGLLLLGISVRRHHRKSLAG